MNKVTNEVLVIAERMYDNIKKEEKEYQRVEETNWPLRYEEYTGSTNEYKRLEELFIEAFGGDVDSEYVRYHMDIFLDYYGSSGSPYSNTASSIKEAIKRVTQKKDFVSLIDLISILMSWCM